jgi:hypothetical protein
MSPAPHFPYLFLAPGCLAALHSLRTRPFYASRSINPDRTATPAPPKFDREQLRLAMWVHAEVVSKHDGSFSTYIDLATDEAVIDGELIWVDGRPWLPVH